MYWGALGRTEYQAQLGLEASLVAAAARPDPYRLQLQLREAKAKAKARASLCASCLHN